MNTVNFVLTNSNEYSEIKWLYDIPFNVSRKESVVCAIGYNVDVYVNEMCSILFFLGMTTEDPRCSEWWGQDERNYYYAKRLFIGDRIGKISILYEDDSMDIVPVIFGVNVWPYELFNEPKENEKKLNRYGGPYLEPFSSDKEAERLLKDSLILMENDAEKAMKYIMGVKVKRKPINRVWYQKESYKEAGLVISAVTGLRAGVEIKPIWKAVDTDFFLKKSYYASMTRLAKRLYQFREDIPLKDDICIPDGYQGPKVRFRGNGIADILTNVYMTNLHDMAENKVDEDGTTHTSSPSAPNFGLYIGFGTYSCNSTPYSAHMWARDIGRVLLELVKSGESERTKKAGEVVNKYLYDRCIKYKLPHWKRIINSYELRSEKLNVEGVLVPITEYVAGKENDGHAAIMVFIYNLYLHGLVDKEWLKENIEALRDAVNWFDWQMQNPDKSGFDKVLYSESEASTQKYGGYDLFSNTYALYALESYKILAQELEDKVLMQKCKSLSAVLKKGIMEKFTSEHPKFGRIFADTIEDVWTWEYKRFSPLFLLADIYTYDPAHYDAELYQICKNTYLAQKEDYFSYAAGRQMGYGQGYLTQTCILLDEYEDLTGCVEQAAMFCYHHSDYNYIVPEGIIMHPSGRFWYRNCDLGNGVQQGEIIKCARLLIGLDDLNPEKGLCIIPRIPDTWSSIEVEDYKIAVMSDGKKTNALLSMKYERCGEGYRIEIKSNKPVEMGSVRLGPFSKDFTDFYIEGGHSCFRKEQRSGRQFVYAFINKEIRELTLQIAPKY